MEVSAMNDYVIKFIINTAVIFAVLRVFRLIKKR